MLWLSYFLTIALHTLYLLLVVAVPFLVLAGLVPRYPVRLTIALIIIIAAGSLLILRGCPLTSWQRSIENKLWPEKKIDHGFIQENLARLGVPISRSTVRILIFFFVALDLFLLLFWGKVRG